MKREELDALVSGVRELARMADSAAMSWRTVHEIVLHDGIKDEMIDLPDSERTVLVMQNGYATIDDHAKRAGGPWGITTAFYDGRRWYGASHVTHWMELPAIPVIPENHKSEA